MAHRDPRLGVIGFLALTLAVLFGLVMFSRYPSVLRTGVAYQAVFHNVAGLNRGDEVRYGGLLVGVVSNLDIDPKDPARIIVRFRVKKTIPVRSDTRATVSTIGMLGQPFLSLVPGTVHGRALAENDFVPSEDSPSFQDAMSRLASFIDRADTLLMGAERIANTSPLERIDHTLQRLDELVTSAQGGSTKTFARFDSAGLKLEHVLDRSDRLLATLDTTARTVGPGFQQTQKEALDAAHELRLLLGSVREALAQEGGAETLARNLAITTDNLARLTSRLERDPTSVLKKRAPVKKTAGPDAR
ncbi:MAG: transporter permease [Gemmatimonadetes bacterium]|nr:transporter permease [Gemmatimonadota bacterium]